MLLQNSESASFQMFMFPSLKD